MDHDEADKILTQALFVQGADRLERKFLTDENALLALMVSALAIACPDVDLTINPTKEGVIDFQSKVRNNRGSLPASSLTRYLDPQDHVKSRSTIVEYIIRRSEAIIGFMSTETMSHDRERLLATILTNGALADLGDNGHDLVTWPVGRDLSAVLGTRFHNTVAFIGRSHLDELGLDETEAKAVALDNLKALLSTTPPEIQTGDNRTLLIGGFEGRAHSHLLIPDYLNALRFHIDDDVFVYVLKSGIVVVPKSDADEVDRIVGLAESGQMSSLCEQASFVYDGSELTNLTAEDLAALRQPNADGPHNSAPVRRTIN